MKALLSSLSEGDEFFINGERFFVDFGQKAPPPGKINAASYDKNKDAEATLILDTFPADLVVDREASHFEIKALRAKLVEDLSLISMGVQQPNKIPKDILLKKITEAQSFVGELL